MYVFLNFLFLQQHAKLQVRVEAIEKGNAVLRNLDLDTLVTPGALEQKVRLETNMVLQSTEFERTNIVNMFEERYKQVYDVIDEKLLKKVSKQDF